MKGLCQLFAKTAEYALAIGVRNIKDLPGCWEADLSEDVHVSVNGGAAERKDAGGYPLPAYNALFRWGGWPVALCTPAGGVVLGPDDTEERLLGVVEAALRRVILETDVEDGVFLSDGTEVPF